MTTQYDFGSILGQSLDAFFWALKFHGYGSWLVCEVALSYSFRGQYASHILASLVHQFPIYTIDV